MPILVKKPLSLLDQKLKVSWGDAIKTLGNSVLHLTAAKYDELPADLAELGAAIDRLEDPGEIAWLLIRRAITRAIADLLRDHRDVFRVGAPEPADLAAAEAAMDLDAEVLEIDERFFLDPGALDLLERMRPSMARWLQIFGLGKPSADAVSERLRPYFVLALHDEWARAPNEYAKLATALDTPFTRAKDAERAWLRYGAYLQRLVHEPMFAEPFGLSSVYVPLRGFWEQEVQVPISVPAANAWKGEPPLVAYKKQVQRVVVDLATALDDWLLDNKRNDAIRVLSGGPGSGKSSFARMYAAQTMLKGSMTVLLIPLHLLDPTSDLVSAVGEYVRMSRTLPTNPLEATGSDEPRRLLLLFDGLDELAMQGKLAAETAQQFLREVERTTDKLNQMKAWVSVLISGRELVVQANHAEFRRLEQTLHILPYAIEPFAVSPQEEGGSRDTPEWVWKDEGGIRERDQRAEWWQKYCLATRTPKSPIPDEFLEGELGDITRQPLILYLVALSAARKKLALRQPTNLNDVYADLIDAVWERAYEGHRFTGIKDLGKEKFIRFLEEIGLASWHDEGRTTTIKSIREHFESAAITPILDAFQRSAEAGVLRLLAAFYFRQHGERDSEKTFEFTHQSFGEYLAACRIVRTLALLDEELTLHESNADRGKTLGDALATWADVCGAAALDPYYVRFLNREIARRGRDCAAKWQPRIAAMMSLVARSGMPMERARARGASFAEDMRRARNAEEALFACAAATSDVTLETTRVEWPSATSAGAWLKRLQGQRRDVDYPVVVTSLRGLNLDGCCLAVSDFYGANLSRTSLRGADLQGANFQGAELSNASLMGANVDGADFENARIEGASFEGVNVRSARRPPPASLGMLRRSRT